MKKRIQQLLNEALTIPEGDGDLPNLVIGWLHIIVYVAVVFSLFGIDILPSF
jgi:hypothetical protein